MTHTFLKFFLADVASAIGFLHTASSSCWSGRAWHLLFPGHHPYPFGGM